MKCIILAGGKGERLWPLSRKSYPKQFVPIQGNHSLFQETVSRNLPFCDEFLIVTDAKYRFIVENQMRAFQGTPYRCIFEEESHGTLNAIALAGMELVPSEYVFVVVSDHVIYTRPESNSDEMDYKDCVMLAKSYASEGNISLFTLRETEMKSRFGYILDLQKDGTAGRFVEKPSAEEIEKIDLRQEAVYRNLGMLLYRVDAFLETFKRIEPEEYAKLENTFRMRQSGESSFTYSIEGSEKTYALWEAGSYGSFASNYSYYSRESEAELSDLHIARTILEKTDNLKAVKGVFLWNQIDTLEDLQYTDYRNSGPVVSEDCWNTSVINYDPNQTVVLNGIDNVVVANTRDAVYISRAGRSSEIREIVSDNTSLYLCAEQGKDFYRPWGRYEQLVEEENYRIRRVFVPVGGCIPSHKHTKRSENLMIVSGSALILKDGKETVCDSGDIIDFPAGTEHEIKNNGEDELVFVETAVGLIEHGRDMVVSGENEENGVLKTEPLVRLSPAFKDYLWGGTLLRDRFGMDCDYDKIAEAWVMSAHHAGQSILSSGRYRGMHFNDYVKGIGKEALGWKCSPLQNFPLLIKFIDARDNLSVQVHPNDDYALENENEYGKNEMWYVIDAKEGAGLYVGFNRDVSKEEVRTRIENDTILEVLNFYETKPGDVYYIPAGTVHAIGAGNFICEIQQSSNATYRLYDYHRKDKYGNTRELHIDKSLDVLNFKKYVPQQLDSEKLSAGTLITRCKYFESVVYDVNNREVRIPVDAGKFSSFVCMKGTGSLHFLGNTMDLKAGDCIFVPAMDGILTAEGDMTLLMSHV